VHGSGERETRKRIKKPLASVRYKVPMACSSSMTKRWSLRSSDAQHSGSLGVAGRTGIIHIDGQSRAPGDLLSEDTYVPYYRVLAVPR
jgi:hypothetical protein